MYKGNNPTALQSQEMIIKGMISIMETESFKSITVKKLCEQSLVSRQTFYSLFDSKEDVLELHFDRIFEVFIYNLTREEITMNYICREFVSYISRNEYFIKLLVHNNLTHIMTLKFEEYLIKIGSALGVSKDYMYEYAMAFMAGALVGIVVRYIRDENYIEKKELAMIIEKILKGEYFVVN